MIDQLITALNQEIEMSAVEIADTIWLAMQIETQAESVSSVLPLTTENEKEINPQRNPLNLEKVPETSDSETTTNQPPEEQKAGVYPHNQQQTSKSANFSIKVPDAPSLREPLTLARALKPLMRRVPSGRELILDETATIQRIADERIWIPVLKPTVEPWLDLELVVDESISMQIWRNTIKELEQLLKNYGIFRDVRIWGLITDENEQLKIRRGIGAAAKNQTPRSPKELIDSSSRRLVLVVSDCVSSLWRSGAVTPVLEIWAKYGSMAIIQMLPKWLWKRTALGRTSEVRLRGLTPGMFNQNLIAKEVSLWDELDEERGVKVPVFTLEPDKVNTWAQMLSGKGSIWTLGYVFKLDIPVKKEPGLFNLNHSNLSPEQRVQAFRVTASPMARKLAGFLASAPVISLPIVRLIRETMLKESQQVHVAEVFLGGLLKPLSEINIDTTPDYVQYDFIDGVRELLVDSVPSQYVLNVVDEVSKYVAKKVGLSLADFAAVLRNPQAVKDSGIVEDVGYFATMTAQVLRGLGGEYVKVADELENNILGNEIINNPIYEYDNTKIYSLCTDNPWNLKFDTLVIPMGNIIMLGNSLAPGGGFSIGFQKFLGDKLTVFKQSVAMALGENEQNQVSPNKPLLVPLNYQINELLSVQHKNIYNFNRFVIITTVESPKPSIFNAGKAIECIINLAVKQGLKHIVLPLFGTGNIGLPYDEVAHQMLLAINLSLKKLSSNSIEQIIFVDRKQSTIETINQVAERLFVQQDIDKLEKFSETGVDYTQLRDLLAAGKWKEADKETARLMFKIADREEELTLEDIENFSDTDLQIIDQLWVKHSKGHFGFSVQKKIWQELGEQVNIETERKLCELIGCFSSEEGWLDYDDYTFSLDAPKGHLPASCDCWGIDDYETPSTCLLMSKFSKLSQQRRIRPYLFSGSDVKVKLENFEFETVIVNNQGQIIKTEPKQAQYFIENLPDNNSLEMIAILGDKFMMGSPEGEGSDREKPQHEVIVQPFFMGKYPVTQAQWRAVADLPKVNLDLNPDPSNYKGDHRPVERVSWDEAIEFCDRLSKLTGRKYGLPSEAEWEYACRAGTTTPFCFGETITGELANYYAEKTFADEPARKSLGKITTVGKFLPNAFGLYDMHGNVQEWCLDIWHNNYKNAPIDGREWKEKNVNKNKGRVIRGGAFTYFPEDCRSAFRSNDLPQVSRHYVGFRVVCFSETN